MRGYLALSQQIWTRHYFAPLGISQMNFNSPTTKLTCKILGGAKYFGEPKSKRDRARVPPEADHTLFLVSNSWVSNPRPSPRQALGWGVPSAYLEPLVRSWSLLLLKIDF